jgi:ribosomal protein S18 acetylase RimI-like enzyme
MAITIRVYQPEDRKRLQDVTEAAFPGASIEKLIEQRHGVLNGTTWADRKRREIAADCDANPGGIFVAEDAQGEVVGYITTRLWQDARMGWIPNLAVLPGHQGQGIGRRLLEQALAYFRAEGMTHAKIETLAVNEVGNHLYPSLGFEELIRQVHFTMAL